MPALVWTEIEANTSVICCCLPALRLPLLNLWHKLRGGKQSPVPTVDRPDKVMYDNAWTGPQHSRAVASHGFSKPQVSHQSNRNSGPTGFHSNTKSGHSTSTGSKTVDTWYDRVLGSIGAKEKDPNDSPSPRDSIADDVLASGGNGDSITPAPRLQLGEIYKTTDVHVSMHNIHRNEEDLERGRQVSLADMLNER